MQTGTFNVLFFAGESDLHYYYFVEDGTVHFMSDRFLESELPSRLQGMRHLGIQSVTVYLLKEKPKSLSDWQKHDFLLKELTATHVIKLKPQDSVEVWIARVHEEMRNHKPELAELAVTALKASG